MSSDTHDRMTEDSMADICSHLDTVAARSKSPVYPVP
jgi:hypothetical protein